MADDGLELLWFLRVAHPDAAVRERASSSLRAAAEAAPAAGMREAILEALRTERGTALEPFELEDGDMHEACDLAILAGGASRGLRVVSRDKLEPHGGLLLDVTSGTLRTTYLERLATSDALDDSVDAVAWRFAPGLRPNRQEAAEAAVDPTVQVIADERGYAIRIGQLDLPATVDEDKHVIRYISGPTGAPPPRWRLQPSGDGHTLEMRPAAPEEAIQLTAFMLQKAWFTIELGDLAHGLQRLAIQLDLPGPDRRGELPSVRMFDQDGLAPIHRWLLTDNVADVPERFADLLVDLGTWLGLVPGWESGELMERYS